MSDKHSARNKGGGFNNKAFAAVAVMTFLGMYAFTMTTSAVVAEKEVAAKVRSYILENYAYDEAVENEEELIALGSQFTNLDDAIVASDIKFTASPVADKCVGEMIYDDFDQSPVVENVLYVNKYNSDYWTVYGSEKSGFLAQASKGYLVATGSSNNPRTPGVLITSKHKVTGDFKAFATGISIPNNNDSSGSSSIYKFGLWQEGDISSGVMIVKDRENRKFAATYSFNKRQEKFYYYNQKGEEKTSFSRAKTSIPSGDMTIAYQRRGRFLSATITVGNKVINLGSHLKIDTGDGYLNMSYGIQSQTRTTIAQVDRVTFSGCFK